LEAGEHMADEKKRMEQELSRQRAGETRIMEDMARAVEVKNRQEIVTQTLTLTLTSGEE